MGVRWCYTVLLWMPFCVCVFQIMTAVALKGFTLCDIQECNCTIKAASWKNIICNLHVGQVLNLEDTNVPDESFEIFINGGQEITFRSKTFNSLHALTLIQFNGTKKIVMERKSFFDIKSPSLLVEIQNCDELIFKTGAFDYAQSSVSTQIVNANFVVIEQGAFSKLFNSTFKDVRKMQLSEGSFEFKSQGNIGNHGPATIISFINVVIPKIPKEVFTTALASLTFRNCEIGDLHTEAFKAAEISAVTLINSTLKNIQEKAFTDRTLICEFKISKCNISKLQSKAIMAGIGNLTLSHSIIMDIEPKAIITTVAKIEVIGNQIVNLQTSGFVFNNWNKIMIDDNIFENLHTNFIEAPVNTDIEKFSFKGNEIYAIEQGALQFVSDLDEKVLIFNDNFFNKSCDCFLNEWLEQLTNGSQKLTTIMRTSFCQIDDFLSVCYNWPIGKTNIQNFTETSCDKNITCIIMDEPKVVNETTKNYFHVSETEKQNWLIFIIVVVGLFILTILVSFIVLLIRGSRWLKRKGYFRNVQCNNNDQSIEEENTIVTVDENEKLDIPEELTLEFLQVLSKRLDDPTTHQEASEMIERLYEMFIVEDSYENNNRQDEEAHLYEELGNLNLQIPPPPYEEEKPHNTNGPRSILKLMEEKFNFQNEEQGAKTAAPSLVVEYSEPTDAAVHLYSELKNRNDKISNCDDKDSLKSSNSAKVNFRPLPKPTNSIFEAGPSTKL